MQNLSVAFWSDLMELTQGSVQYAQCKDSPKANASKWNGCHTTLLTLASTDNECILDNTTPAQQFRCLLT